HSALSTVFSLPAPSRRPSSALFPYTTLFRSAFGLVLAAVTIEPGFSSESFKIYLRNRGMTTRNLGRLSAAKLYSLSLSVPSPLRSEEHTSELQSPYDLVCRLLLETENHTFGI